MCSESLEFYRMLAAHPTLTFEATAGHACQQAVSKGPDTLALAYHAWPPERERVALCTDGALS